jgi:hypothetical protein
MVWGNSGFVQIGQTANITIDKKSPQPTNGEGML